MGDIEELQEEAIAVGWDIRYTQYEAGWLDGTLTELGRCCILGAPRSRE